MKTIFFFMLILLPLVFSGCGKAPQSPKPEQEVEEEGIFAATLYPVNQRISPNLKSVATISKFGDDFRVKIKFRNGSSSVHVQGLYSGYTCPYDDTDGNGSISMAEAQKHVGKILIPFDGDLSGRSLGSGTYPSSSGYVYERSASYGLMISDLPPEDQNLHLQDKVILISDNDKPVACGTLSSVLVEPEDIPDPIRVRPRPHPAPTYQPMPQPEYHPPHRTSWRRFRDRLGRWWRRIRGG